MNLPIRFGPEVCSNLAEAVSREWLETNGIGGFASSTLAGMNTRRYHGLLVAAEAPPLGRLLLLSKLEETVVAGSIRYELSVNRYPGVLHPRGHPFLREFRLDPFPVFTYEIEGLTIEKRVFMVDGENTTVVEYRLDGALEGLSGCSLEIRPLVAFRGYHDLTRENPFFDGRVAVAPGVATLTPYQSLPPLQFAHDASDIELTGHWYYRLEYDAERERGLDFTEDLFNPFVLRFDMSSRRQAAVIASTSPQRAVDASFYREAEIERRRRIADNSPSRDPLVQSLTTAAHAFIIHPIIHDNERHSVVAGYHWFTEWGRDAMIALPGLMLAGGEETAARILHAFAGAVSEGMIPNRFPDADETPEYNTADATLWFFEAVRVFVERTGDSAFAEAFLELDLVEMIDWHIRGTRYGIRAAPNGLLSCGEPGVQLTWMDAKIGDWVVTPRAGQPVEIQALWYNALRIAADLTGERSFTALADRARESFNALFWNEEEGCLYDVIDGEHRDGSVRPNQIFAVSLGHSMLGEDRARRVVEKVERELLTPLGLRSLSPRDPRYRGRYEGDVRSRDSAYHQGTVWPWLMGPFIKAYVKVNGGGEEAREQAARWLDPFRAHLYEAGLGQVSEIFDGDRPHRPAGCIAQAWSVAELLRAAVEDARLR